MPPFHIELPGVSEMLSQDEEWCRVTIGGKSEVIRFHDYARIFDIPGLYEALFYDRLACDSPRTILGYLAGALEQAGVDPAHLRGLDLGAGNGMVGEAARATGISELVGVDIIPGAAEATERDRPGIYRDYVVADLTALTEGERERILAVRPNLLTCVAALGFGDVPAEVFTSAFNLVETPAWVAFNIKDAFLDPAADQTGFSKLVRRLLDAGHLEPQVQQRYRHRLSVAGPPLHYVAIIGRKRQPIPMSWLADL